MNDNLKEKLNKMSNDELIHYLGTLRLAAIIFDSLGVLLTFCCLIFEGAAAIVGFGLPVIWLAVIASRASRAEEYIVNLLDNE